MILNDTSDIKVGSQQVVEVRAGTELVWPTIWGDVWTFGTPTGGQEVKVIANFSGYVTIDWGDGDTDTLTNNVSINHIY